MNFPKIEFVYFDLGNVVVNFDHQMSCHNLAAITELDGATINSALYESGLQDQYELGNLNDQEFAFQLNSELGTSVSTTRLCHAISDIFWLNRPIMPLISQVSAAGIPIGILSNTCHAHWSLILDKWPGISRLFPSHSCILSYEVNCKKPQPAIYSLAIEKAGIPAEHIFFVDDLAQNVAGAAKTGMQTNRYTSSNDLMKCLVNRSLKFNL